MGKNAENLRVLIVEDSLFMINLEKKILSSLGVTQIEEARDGDAAIEMLESEQYDLVILDNNMPKKTGLEILRDMRANSNPNKETAVVMVTSESAREHVLEIAKLGVKAYIVKSLSAENFEMKIKRVVETL